MNYNVPIQQNETCEKDSKYLYKNIYKISIKFYRVLYISLQFIYPYSFSFLQNVLSEKNVKIISFWGGGTHWPQRINI